LLHAKVHRDNIIGGAWYHRSMSRTLVDVDPDLLTAASEVLGTRTKKDTVTAALRAAVAAAAQRRELDMIRTGAWADPDNLDSVRTDAWRR
jgi:Arc/MetJ family transcription regulator